LYIYFSIKVYSENRHEKMPELTTEILSAMSRYEIEGIQRALRVCLDDSKPSKLEHFVLCLKKEFSYTN
jgi:hypothetical protein